MHPTPSYACTAGTSICATFSTCATRDKVTTEYSGTVAQFFQLVHTGDYVQLDVLCEVYFRQLKYTYSG